MKGFAVRQELDHLERRPFARVAAAALVAFACAIVTAGALLVHWRGARLAPASPAPGSTVERSLAATTERGIEERRAAREALSRAGIEHAMDAVAADAGAEP